MKVAIVKYNAGNIYSVVNALKRMGVEPLLTDNAEELRQADRVVFPGQGEARGAMEYLRAQQLLCRHSDEGDTDCIGVFDVDVRRFQPQRHEDKVPCMGWNALSLPQPLQKEGSIEPPSLLKGLEGQYVYFVHSYYVPLCEHTAAVADYILPYSASLHKDNFYTCQFHPEKSGAAGERILKNFLEL